MGGPQFQLEGAQYAAELRILLVYLSESLERLGQNGGSTGGTFFIGGGAAAPLAPRRTTPGVMINIFIITASSEAVDYEMTLYLSKSLLYRIFHSLY